MSGITLSVILLPTRKGRQSMSEEVNKREMILALERRLFGGIELAQFQRVVTNELKRERRWYPLMNKTSPLLDILRELGFKMPAKRRKGRPLRNVSKCILAALKRREGVKVTDIADFLGVQSDKDSYGNYAWSRSAKRYIDEGEEFLSLLELDGIDISLHSSGPIMFAENIPLEEAIKQKKINTKDIVSLQFIEDSMKKEYNKGIARLEKRR